MAYNINLTNGQLFLTLGEGVLDTSTGLSLIGQNYQGYGQLIATNFVRLLENQANSTPPANPIAGQLWWNTATKVMSFFDGNRFKPCASTTTGTNTPLVPAIGDQWWDTTNDQFKIYDGANWVIVGPQYPKGQLFTGTLPMAVTDLNSNSYIISTMQVNGVIVAIFSTNQTFSLSVPINGISAVAPGITLAPTFSLTATTNNSDSYLSDGTYFPGTVMIFGGVNEVTAVSQYCSNRVAGVVASNVNYTSIPPHTAVNVAYAGKIPCKVVGPVQQGDILVTSTTSGVATKLLHNSDWVPGCVVGKSTVTDSSLGVRSIMISVDRF